MGRFIDAIDVLLAPKKKEVDPTPKNVRVQLDDGRVITPVIVKLPPNGHGPDVHEYVAFCPPTIGAFSDCELLVSELPPNVSLSLALMKVRGGALTFAPIPLDLIERVSGVQHIPVQVGPMTQRDPVHDRIGGSSVPS